MYHVLIPVDTDQGRAVAQAEYVASLPTASEDVSATVLTVGDGDFAAVGAAVTAADKLDAAGVDTERRSETGGVTRTILDVAAERESDHLVMGGRKRSATATALLGSTVLDVFRSSDLPVTMTGTDMTGPDGARHLLLPVDSNVERARHQADFVAGLPGVPADVTATVLTVFRHQDYKGAPEHDFEEVDAAVAAAERLAEAGLTVERLGIGGEVASTILDIGEDQEATELVMGGRKRSGVQKVLLGSTVRDLLLSADRPVTVTG